jgi:hypothetical protein
LLLATRPLRKRITELNALRPVRNELPGNSTNILVWRLEAELVAADIQALTAIKATLLAVGGHMSETGRGERRQVRGDRRRPKAGR